MTLRIPIEIEEEPNLFYRGGGDPTIPQDHLGVPGLLVRRLLPAPSPEVLPHRCTICFIPFAMACE